MLEYPRYQETIFFCDAERRHMPLIAMVALNSAVTNWIPRLGRYLAAERFVLGHGDVHLGLSPSERLHPPGKLLVSCLVEEHIRLCRVDAHIVLLRTILGHAGLIDAHESVVNVEE